MDAPVTILKPKKLSLVEAATIGVGSEVWLRYCQTLSGFAEKFFFSQQTAALAVWSGLKVPLPDPNNLPAPKNEWVIVLGGASSVGKFSIQVMYNSVMVTDQSL